MYFPNTTCTFYEKQNGYDLFGEASFAEGVNVPCSVITYDLSVEKTSVRADTSGSRGRADNLTGVARFLFPKTMSLKTGDIVSKDGFRMEIIEVHYRRDVLGNLDHIQVDMRKEVDDSASSS